MLLYDGGGTFPVEWFLNDAAPHPKIGGMAILFKKTLFFFVDAGHGIVHRDARFRVASS